MRSSKGTMGILCALGVLVGGVSTARVYSAEMSLLVGSTGPGNIARYDAQTGAVINLFVFAGSGGLGSGCGNAPLGLLFGPDGHLYVASGGATSVVLRYNGQTGEFLDTFVTDGSGGLSQPSALAFGADGHLYVSSSANDSILRYSGATGAFIDAFVASGVGGLDGPYTLTFGPDGHLYVCSSILAEADVLRYDGTTGAFMDVFALGADFGLFENIAMQFGPDGHLYVSSAHPGKIVRYDGTTGAAMDVFVAEGSGGLEDPTGLRFGPDGHLYVSEYIGDVILRYDGTTGAPLPGPLGDPDSADFFPPGSGGLECPWDLVFAKLPPPVCQPSSTPLAETVPDVLGNPVVSTRNRFLSFTAGEAGRAHAIRVTFDALPRPFDLWNGAQMWVGSASQVSQKSTSIVPAAGDATFNAATLSCTPSFQDWSGLGTVHVLHEAIVPGGTYTIQAIDSECTDLSLDGSYSSPLVLATSIFGDTVLDLKQTPPGAAEGAVNIVDALAVLKAFANVPGALVKARADLEPHCLDLKINVSDVLSSLAGFVGLPYPFIATAADPCNSTCTNPLP
ncbi:MAG: NHL repeat-containing protein [Planctomycetes bacterium]|nr:NHL repeat-containing protein [Planctomycetota bacterium]